MSSQIPVVSGAKLIKVLISMGYEQIRQRGSHIRLEKKTNAGTHKITIPNHNPMAKGTLNDILGKESIWNQVSKESIIEKL